MSSTIVADLFDVQSRFLRSAHLERDFRDTTALDGYVLTAYAKSHLRRLAGGLTINSGQRAWRITGDYGSGKSSFALLLAHLFAADTTELPDCLRTAVDFDELRIEQPRLFPILVTGSNEQIAAALLRSTKDALQNAFSRSESVDIVDEISYVLMSAGTSVIADNVVVNLLEKANGAVTASKRYGGLLIIIDELGRFLEHAATHAECQGVGLLQSIAEVACRSGRHPLFLVGLLHQGFNAYAELLSPTAQKEWEKVAGRFEELLFNQPLDQTALLVADALNLRIEHLRDDYAREAKSAMEKAIALGWYGASPTKQTLVEMAPRLYPLHPTVLPILIRLFNRFGQNERSLFSFLLSNDEFGLQAFSSQPLDEAGFFRLHHLYDYVRFVFGHRLSVQSYRSHWNQIDSMVQSFCSGSEIEMRILKTVGLLNLLDTNNYLPSTNVISLAVAGDAAENHRILVTLNELQKSKHILHYRGSAGGYCLWPYTSVDLDRAREDAQRAIGTVARVVPLVRDFLQTNSLVARRHYIETGNLRHFEVHYGATSSLEKVLNCDATADGYVLIPLSETSEEHNHAVKFAQSERLSERPDILVAVPAPLQGLVGLVQEVQCWEWISRNTPELNQDKWAAEEVSRQVIASRQMLLRRLQDIVGLQPDATRLNQVWFHRTKLLPLQTRRDLLSKLSDICGEVYDSAPVIANELVNRRSLSSAAAAARMRLIERMFDHPNKPMLGMAPDKKPPEMSMYLSVLKRAALHKERNGTFAFRVPDTCEDVCRVLPVLHKIKSLLEITPDSRVSVTNIIAELKRAPYGIRDGLIPLFLAVFALIHEQNVAFYENGSFLRQVDGDEFLRLIKNPSAFEMQYCSISGIRTELFDELVAILGLSDNTKRLDILDVVKPLCVFAANLPGYTHKTNKLSVAAKAVRNTLTKAREPGKLIFADLPAACGFDSFGAQHEASSDRAMNFVTALKAAIDELRAAYSELLQRIQSYIGEAFDLADSPSEVRKLLEQRVDNIIPAVNETRLKAFCVRLKDSQLSETEWLESVASFLCSKPAQKWTDGDESVFRQELSELCGRFRRVESIIFKASKRLANTSAVRVSITQSDGTEVDEVLCISSKEQERVDQLEAQITSLLVETKKLGVAAASRALWKALKQLDNND